MGWIPPVGIVTPPSVERSSAGVKHVRKSLASARNLYVNSEQINPRPACSSSATLFVLAREYKQVQASHRH